MSRAEVEKRHGKPKRSSWHAPRPLAVVELKAEVQPPRKKKSKSKAKARSAKLRRKPKLKRRSGRHAQP